MAALPSIRKPVTIAAPRKGKHGVFAVSEGGDALDSPPSLTLSTGAGDSLSWKPSVASLGDTSQWSGIAPSWNSGFLPPATPRKLAPFAPPSTGELAPLGWARVPMAAEGDPRRHLTDGKELVEAKRALRGIVPGDWDARLFTHYRRKFTDEGRWLAIPGLTDDVRKTSQAALNAGWYTASSHRGGKVRLSQRPNVQWLGFESIVESDPCSGVPPPPLVVSHSTPLEATCVLRDAFKGHPLIVTMEAIDFSKPGAGRGTGEGRLLESEQARSIAQQEMFLCTNFQFSSRMATHLCAKGPSPQARLTSNHEPAMFVAGDVVQFRGSLAQGYPFLTKEEQMDLTVLVTGRAVKRPWFGPRGETFQNQEDNICLLDRLNLVTFKALEHWEPGGKRPVLVMSAAGLADAENRQPRASYAQALKTWRSLWAGHFEAVIIACGDEPTAAMIDRTVNTDIYMQVLQNLPLVPSSSQYHWNVAAMKLSTNPVFANVASKIFLQRQHGASPPDSRTGSARPTVDVSGRRQSGGRRASGAGMLMLQEALSGSERSAGAIIVKEPDPKISRQLSSLSKSEAGGEEMPAVDIPQDEEPVFQKRRSSVAASRKLSGSSLAVPQGALGERRRSSAAIGAQGVPEDSKQHTERLAKMRLEDEQRNHHADPMQQARASLIQKVDPEREVKAQANMSTAAAAFQEFGGGAKTEVMERPAQGMTLEKKRQIDTQAAMYDMPFELKDHIFKAIDKQLKYGNRDGVAVSGSVEDGQHHGDGEEEDVEEKEEGEHAKKDATAPGAEEAGRVFEEVSRLAELLEPVLVNKRKETAGAQTSRTHNHRKGADKETLPPLTAR
mmetsp:Transcript_49721/g.89288  ORF Transcript_49721/g.89288 Transcript_49721/m.89288 type:complete len:838 (+) Transcript_49721:20-2533(+)